MLEDWGDELGLSFRRVLGQVHLQVIGAPPPEGDEGTGHRPRGDGAIQGADDIAQEVFVVEGLCVEGVPAEGEELLVDADGAVRR